MTAQSLLNLFILPLRIVFHYFLKFMDEVTQVPAEDDINISLALGRQSTHLGEEFSVSFCQRLFFFGA